jgi:tetratricopeptide (TPR) repeat protein
MSAQGGNRFSALLLEGLDHYRKGRMLDAVRAWEEAYLLEPTNLRAREFLRSALERIHAVMSPTSKPGAATAAHPWLPAQRPSAPAPAPSRKPVAAAAGAARKAAPAPKPEEAAEKKSAPPPSDRSPWDEGPSVAIPQPEVTGEGSNGAWSIHRDKAPAQSVANDEPQVWMRGARELVALNDFSGALELLSKVLDREPNDSDARKLHDSCEHNLILMFESKIGSMDARPKTAIPPDEIIWLNLDPRAGFVLAQIDGEVSFDDLYAICGLKRLDTARILCELLEQGVVRVEGREKPVAKRAVPRT